MSDTTAGTAATTDSPVAPADQDSSATTSAAPDPAPLAPRFGRREDGVLIPHDTASRIYEALESGKPRAIRGALNELDIVLGMPVPGIRM